MNKKHPSIIFYFECPKCGCKNEFTSEAINQTYHCTSCGATFEYFPPVINEKPNLRLISEFIDALNEEIKAIESDKGSAFILASDGQLIREEPGLFLYTFTLENPIDIPDETPVEVKVGDKQYYGKIVQSKGMEIIIGLEQSLGDYVSEARLIVNFHFLPKLLEKKFRNLLDRLSNQEVYQIMYGSPPPIDTYFHLSNLVFQNSCGWKGNFKFVLNCAELNESQIKAIEKSQSQQFTILWGPPGTGKTKTLAYMVYCFVKRGLKVLVVAHTNAAVDELTEKIVDLLEDTNYYKQGQIVRLGICGDKIKDKFVSLDKIVEKFSSKLKQEIALLKRRKKEIEEELISLLCSKLEEILQQKELHVKSLLSKLQQVESMSKLKRFILGLNPYEIRKKVEREQLEVKKIEEVLTKCKERHTEEDLNSLKSKIQELGRLLSELKLMDPEVQKKWKNLEKELDNLQLKIHKYEDSLNEIRKKVLLEVRVLCTTLTKTFSDKDFPDIPFDVLIVDEGRWHHYPIYIGH